MTKDKKIDRVEEIVSTESSTKQKTCFIIMPIADHPDYESGHFDRVYEYLIKPACISAGYQPIRADDSKASHMIMFDILKKIVECDMAICDLSSKNANVFYELGLRQAFNKKTILITDGRDKAPFDIAGFRYVSYSPSLRIDAIKKEIADIKLMLNETESAPEEDVNSIVKLLKIQPAKVEPVLLNQNESVIFDMFNKLQSQLNSLARNQNFKAHSSSIKYLEKISFNDFLREKPYELHNYPFSLNGKYLGYLSKMTESSLIFSNGQQEEFISNTERNRELIELTATDKSNYDS